MNRIRLLPEQVANQIAAGEVIERPASVVKELVENALDAQATRLTVEVQAGGRGLIRVTDDGVGMNRDDALLCFERHATSKLARAEDLQAIATLGFRGEALPSIASVSRLTLTTRERGESGVAVTTEPERPLTPSLSPTEGEGAQRGEPGSAKQTRDSENVEATQIVIHGGKLLDVRTAGAPVGTCVEVRQLFFNLPARRKFLKSETTERAHIHHYLLLAALAYPETGFTLVDDRRTIWQLPPIRFGLKAEERLAAVRERLRALYGADLNLLTVQSSQSLSVNEEVDPELDATSEAGGEARSESVLRLWGFIGAPGVSRATREDQHLFVNRRPVENRALNFALLEGYHTALMKGRYPVCCLFLEIDPALVDINIHPAKREVKFRIEREVRSLVARAVRDTLLDYHALPAATEALPPSRATTAPTASVGSSPTELWPPPTSVQPTASHQIPLSPRRLPSDAEAASARSDRVVPGSVSASEPAVSEPGRPPSLPSPSSPARLVQGSGPRPAVSPLVGSDASPVRPPTPLLGVPLRLVGVIGRLYVVLESDRGLVLLDQHAAHERVLFEQMLAQLERGAVPSQRLLLPETVELSIRDAHFLRELLPTLTRLGVGVSEFGERTFLLDSLPPFVRTQGARQFVLELIDELKATGQEVNALRLGEQMVAKTVCRHAVKANDPLDGRELENLVEDLRHCAMPYTCPHGRPTLIEFNYRELEKKFGRSA